MQIKKVIPGLLAAFLLFTASAASAGGYGNWSFSVNVHNGHPSYHINVGSNRHRAHHWRYKKRWHKRGRHHRRHHGNRYRHGHQQSRYRHYNKRYNHGRRGGYHGQRRRW